MKKYGVSALFALALVLTGCGASKEATLTPPPQSEAAAELPLDEPTPEPTPTATPTPEPTPEPTPTPTPRPTPKPLRLLKSQPVDGTNSTAVLPLKSVSRIHIENDTFYALGEPVDKFPIALSSDAGRTWSVYQAFSSDLGIPVAMASFEKFLYLATRENGIAVSPDGGRSWTSINTSNTSSFPSNTTFGVIRNGGRLYVHTDKGVAFSNDRGATWSLVPQFKGHSVRHFLAQGSLVVGAHLTNLWISTNGGETWVQRDLGSQITSLTLDKEHFYAGTQKSQLYRCTAETNCEIETSLERDDVQILSLAKSDGEVFLSTNLGLWKGKTGESDWKNFGVNDGLVNTGQAFFHKNILHVVGGIVSYTSDKGESWQQITPVARLEKVLATRASENRIFALETKALHVSRDGGGTWEIRSCLSRCDENKVHADLDVSGKTVLIATNRGVEISEDGGNKWTLKTTEHGLSSNHVNRLYRNGNTVYAATDLGPSVSSDGGKTWNRLGEGTQFQAGNGIVGQDKNLLFHTKEKLFLSADLGQTLQEVAPSSVGGESVQKLFSSSTPGKAFVATEKSLALTKDLGKTWSVLTYATLRLRNTESIVSVVDYGEALLLATNTGRLVGSEDGETRFYQLGVFSELSQLWVHEHVILASGTFEGARGVKNGILKLE